MDIVGPPSAGTRVSVKSAEGCACPGGRAFLPACGQILAADNSWDPSRKPFLRCGRAAAAAAAAPR